MANPAKANHAGRESSITSAFHTPGVLVWKVGTKKEQIILCRGRVDNHLAEENTGRSGANSMDLRKAGEGGANWPENALLHGPVFVPHKKRVPWERSEEPLSINAYQVPNRRINNHHHHNSFLHAKMSKS